jgi:hypothetical protein
MCGKDQATTVRLLFLKSTTNSRGGFPHAASATVPQFHVAITTQLNQSKLLINVFHHFIICEEMWWLS